LVALYFASPCFKCNRAIRPVVTNETIRAIAALFGGDGLDRLFGGNGNDWLVGLTGNDQLEGGKGNDYLLGGAGADTFVMKDKGGHDTVFDFENGVDRFDVSDLGLRGMADVHVVGQGTQGVLLQFSSDAQFFVVGAQVGDFDASDFVFR